jgi:hypothetical protein
MPAFGSSVDPAKGGAELLLVTRSRHQVVTVMYSNRLTATCFQLVSEAKSTLMTELVPWTKCRGLMSTLSWKSSMNRTANQLIFMLCFGGMVAVAIDTTAAQIAPTGYTIPDITLSPDHRYGVTVPGLDTPDPHNSLIETKTGRVLAEIQAITGYENANHISLAPSRWTRDNSYLLWEVDGKWCDTALVILKIENGNVEWQRDLLKIGQQGHSRTHKTGSSGEISRREGAKQREWLRLSRWIHR